METKMVGPKTEAAVEAEAAIRALLKECAEGRSDCEAEALAKADEAGFAEDWIRESFATARKVWAKPKPEPVRRRRVLGVPKAEGDFGKDLGAAIKARSETKLKAAPPFCEEPQPECVAQPKAEPEAEPTTRIMLPAVIPPPPASAKA
jgi:hypothetical protein